MSMNENGKNENIRLAFPDDGGKAPRAVIWEVVQAQLDHDPAQRGLRLRLNWLRPLAVTSVIIIVAASVWINKSSTQQSSPTTSQSSTMAWLMENDPQRYQQNEAAFIAIQAAIDETRQKLAAAPGNDYLNRKLAYYQSWHSDIESELLKAAREDSGDA